MKSNEMVYDEKILDSELHKMEYAIHDIFNFEVDNRQINDSAKHIKFRRIFWDSLYIERIMEIEKFMDVMDADARLVLITGPIGSGKSTFTRHKFEKANIVKGLIIDMKGESLNESDALINKKGQFDYVRSVVERILIKNFKREIINNLVFQLITKNKELKNILYKTDFDSDNDAVNNEMWKDMRIREEATRRLALEALYYFRLEKDFVDFFDKEWEAGIGEEEVIRDRILKKIKFHKDINGVLSKLTWIHYIRLFQILFPSKKPFFIVFDNLDVLHLDKVKRLFIDVIIDVTNKINRISDYPFSIYGHKPIKIGLTARDENIARFKIDSAAAIHISQIKLAESIYEIPGVKESSSLPFDQELCYKLIKARLDIIRSHIDLNGKYYNEIISTFNSVMSNVWLDERTQTTRSDIGSVEIEKLANESFRLILEFAPDVVWLIIRNFLNRTNYKAELRIIQQKFSNPLYTGLLVKSFWSNPHTKKAMLAFEQENKKEIEGSSFAYHYLLLTYLYNRRNQKRITKTKDIYTAFDETFNFNREVDNNRVLNTLFNSDKMQGDMINIYQDKMVLKPKHIKTKSTIRLNGKGEVFIWKVLIHVDYFGHLTRDRHNINMTLFEMEPKQAEVYLNHIYDFLDSLFLSRKQSWEEIVVPRINCVNNASPFSGSYENKFSIGNSFHLKRVCQSITNSIKTYLSDLITRTRIKDWLNPNDVRNIEKEVSKLDHDVIKEIRLRTFQDDQLEIIFSDLDKNDILYKIWTIVEKFRILENRIDSLQNRDKESYVVTERGKSHE